MLQLMSAVCFMQMGSRQSSGGSQAGPRQAMNSDLGAARGSRGGHRRTASSGQGVPSAGELGPEWTEEVDQVTGSNRPSSSWHFCTLTGSVHLFPRSGTFYQEVCSLWDALHFSNEYMHLRRSLAYTHTFGSKQFPCVCRPTACDPPTSISPPSMVSTWP